MSKRTKTLLKARGLLERRLVRLLLADELIWLGELDQRAPVMNGWFGVGKGKPVEGFVHLEAQRLVKILTASNSIQQEWQ
eukprot:10425939-Karenia_brevis.AAC.1